MKKYIYMQVTQDELELPLAVANSDVELARMVGKSINTIRSCISKSKKRGRKSQYIKVEIMEDDL